MSGARIVRWRDVGSEPTPPSDRLGVPSPVAPRALRHDVGEVARLRGGATGLGTGGGDSAASHVGTSSKISAAGIPPTPNPSPQRGRGVAADALAEIDAIFFEASGRTFEPGAARDAFRERWLGRYLAHDAAHAFVALDAEARVIGYLVGALDDPAKAERFADIAYFKEWAALTARFPAHLHLNLAPAARGHGTGAALIAVFAADARAAGCPGVHVVTGSAARNIGFYGRCGFARAAETMWNGHGIAFLAKVL